MKNKELRFIVTEIFCGVGDKETLAGYGVILSDFLKKNPKKKGKVQKMIAGLDQRFEEFAQIERTEDKKL